MTYYLNKNNSNLLNNDLFFSNFFDREIKALTSDIIETNDSYELVIDVPGFNKKDIKITLENKQLSITAKKELDKEENKKFLRKERFVGTYTRSFFVGDVKQEDIKASIEDGILTIVLPKESYKKVEENKYIEIN